MSYTDRLKLIELVDESPESAQRICLALIQYLDISIVEEFYDDLVHERV